MLLANGLAKMAEIMQMATAAAAGVVAGSVTGVCACALLKLTRHWREERRFRRGVACGGVAGGLTGVFLGVLVVYLSAPSHDDLPAALAIGVGCWAAGVPAGMLAGALLSLLGRKH